MRRIRKGVALVTVLCSLTLLALLGTAYVSNATSSLRIAKHELYDVETTQLCEAGAQVEMGSIWQAFKQAQNFVDLDAQVSGASIGNPKSTATGSVAGVGYYSVSIVGYDQPDPFDRNLHVRVLSWVDLKGNGILDTGEPYKTVDANYTLSLKRSPVFDYIYFVNNYGWMDGFSPSDLFINGDSRANGDFNFLNGTPTVNGSVGASANTNLIPAPKGTVNSPPMKWDNSTYNSNSTGKTRWRPVYNQNRDGDRGSSSYQSAQGLIFDTVGGVYGSSAEGALLQDSTGRYSWTRTSSGQQPVETLVDSNSTQVLQMPDLSNISVYQTKSANYVDTVQNYADGAPNPNYGKGAYVQVYNTTTNSYQTPTTNGVLTGSAALIGTQGHPILIHGPVTFTQDCVIKGVVSGQGTIYTGRNIHIVGSITYKNPPGFNGNNLTAMDNVNQKCDALGLAANGSVIMGDTSQFGSYPLNYMTPPFTHSRLDANGSLIPAFDATKTDATGFKLYQSVMGDSYIHSISENINQIDAFMYTDHCAGGNIGQGGSGIRINGSVISRDEAMVVFSLPMELNYDQRIMDRKPKKSPLIDIALPRSPLLIKQSWQDGNAKIWGR